MKNRTKPQRTSISMSPSELAQVREWAEERGQKLSHFLKQAADAHVRNKDENNKDNSAEKQTALTVNISNRLTDIEHALEEMKAGLHESGEKRKSPESLANLFIELEHFRAEQRTLVANMERLNREMADERMALFRYRNEEMKRLATEPFLLSVWRKLVQR